MKLEDCCVGMLVKVVHGTDILKKGKIGRVTRLYDSGVIDVKWIDDKTGVTGYSWLVSRFKPVVSENDQIMKNRSKLIIWSGFNRSAIRYLKYVYRLRPDEIDSAVFSNVDGLFAANRFAEEEILRELRRR